MGDSADNDPTAMKSFKEKFSVEQEGVFQPAKYGKSQEVESGLEWLTDINGQDNSGTQLFPASRALLKVL